MMSLITGGILALTMAVLMSWYAILLRPRPPWGRGAVAVTMWVGLIGFLGAFGYFLNFQTQPPRLPLFLTFVVLVMLSVVFWSFRGRTLLQNPIWLFIGVQTFRAPLEAILATLAGQGQWPLELTYYGINFDFYVGLTAPVMAAVSYKFGERRSKWPLVAWNLVGLGFLVNVTVRGLLSVPTHFQQISYTPGTDILGSFPMMYLPLFLAPSAYAFHFMSLRRLLRKR